MAEKKKGNKKKKATQIWKLYEAGKPKNKSCPKCGPGVFLAVHKNRDSCGKCGYTIFKGKENK